MIKNAKNVAVVVAAVCLLSGCEDVQFRKREYGALGGAALGAGLGAIVGNQSGNAGAGVAIGSAVGALSGAVVGNQLDNGDDRLSEQESYLASQEAELEENRRILEELRRRGADVRETERGVVVNLPDVLFNFDSAQLKGDAVRSVGEIAEVARSYPERTIAVEGHTDSVGTIAYNQRLSEDRAHSVARELTNRGVSRGRLAVQGFGESDPISTNRSEDGRRRNRRVEVIIEN
jgi:outer membrane protein OmpA-like peptidoglycan-associated protein